MSADDFKVGDMFYGPPLETIVWLQTTNDRLRDLALLFNRDQDPDPPTPEPHRTLLALTFGEDTPVPPGWLDDVDLDVEDPKATAYHLAWVRGVGLAAIAAATAREEGIDCKVYGIRVQPEGAEFPLTYQTAGGDTGALAPGERG